MFVEYYNKATTHLENKTSNGIMHEVIHKLTEPFIKLSYTTISVNPNIGDKLTYALSPSSIYYAKENLIITTGTTNNPEDRGLIDMPNVKLRINATSDKLFYRTKHYNYSDNYSIINLQAENDFTFRKPITRKQQLIYEAADTFNIYIMQKQ